MKAAHRRGRHSRAQGAQSAYVPMPHQDMGQSALW